jgi:hypothetical protein
VATYQTQKTTTQPPASKPKQQPKQQTAPPSDFNSKHPRGAAGSGKGGQFVPLSYNSKTNTGTGYGSKAGDDRVKRLQQALNRLGLVDKNGKRLVVDGKLGPLTTSAIQAAQRKLGLKPDGKVTPALLSQLTKAKAIPGLKTAHQQHVAHLAHQAHVMHLEHLRRTKKPLTPKKPRKTKKPPKSKAPKFDGKPPLKPPPVRRMPWQRAGRAAPSNYRPPVDQ